MPRFDEFRIHFDHYAKVIAERAKRGLYTSNSAREYRANVNKLQQSVKEHNILIVDDYVKQT